MIILLILITLLAANAQAEPYVSFGGGVTHSDDLEELTGITTFKVGSNFHGSVGYRFNNVRVEIEALHIRSPRETFTKKDLPPTTNLDCILTGTCVPTGGSLPTNPPNETVPVSGTETETTALWNVLISIPLDTFIIPYFGGGIGSSGYQIMAGFDINITDDWVFETRYRYFDNDYGTHSLNTVFTYYFGKILIK